MILGSEASIRRVLNRGLHCGPIALFIFIVQEKLFPRIFNVSRNSIDQTLLLSPRHSNGGRRRIKPLSLPLWTIRVDEHTEWIKSRSGKLATTKKAQIHVQQVQLIV